MLAFRSPDDLEMPVGPPGGKQTFGGDSGERRKVKVVVDPD